MGRHGSAPPAADAMTGRARRAVVLVGGPAAPYSRALRLARSLAGEGYEVEIAAITADGVADLERDGPIVIRRYHPIGPFARFATRHVVAQAVAPARPVPPAAATHGPAASPRPRRSRPARVFRGLLRRARLLRQWLLWPQTVRGWWAALARDLAPADLYHACGSLTIAPALRAARASRRAGRPSA